MSDGIEYQIRARSGSHPIDNELEFEIEPKQEPHKQNFTKSNLNLDGIALNN